MLFFFYFILIYSEGFFCEDIYYDIYHPFHQFCGKYAIGGNDKYCCEKNCTFICNYTKVLFQEYYKSACYSSFSYSLCKYIYPSIYMMLIIFLTPTIISTSIMIYYTKSIKPLICGQIKCLFNITCVFFFDFFYCNTGNLYDHYFFFIPFASLLPLNIIISVPSFPMVPFIL